ncbi:MAG: Uncharacterized protein FD137_1602 [Spirochaetes bacterium]|nr:MAG: Uncharacterized protein FD137_1602 [Spirochaetota bacterium]
MYKLNDSAMTTKVDDELLILDPAGGNYFGINPSGTRILEILLAAESLEACIAAIAREYEVEKSRAEADLAAFISRMKEKGLLLEK